MTMRMHERITWAVAMLALGAACHKAGEGAPAPSAAPTRSVSAPDAARVTDAALAPDAPLLDAGAAAGPVFASDDKVVVPETPPSYERHEGSDLQKIWISRRTDKKLHFVLQRGGSCEWKREGDAVVTGEGGGMETDPEDGDSYPAHGYFYSGADKCYLVVVMHGLDASRMKINSSDCPTACPLMDNPMRSPK
jgi:hypothetical protein